ncbi:toxin-antitoxin system YwqK family antitoxin [Namhaeicola litoreus]|uniref:Toxin-antitoxin system YwqK family antitoxin n=1 Tax=Namhaeicola litoreus TaxID=1052145 RepID=A0ABW3Y0K2_9FLAO
MKTLLFSVLTFFICLNAYAQKKNQTITPVGDLFEVTIYYNDGSIMQKGFLNQENQLHASWESFFENGDRKCVATYENGKKVGVWYYWDLNGKKTKVIYQDNKVVSTEEVTLNKEPDLQ